MDAPPGDDDIADLLPWYVNGTLEPGLRDAVTRHLAHSPRCRAELLWLRQVRAKLQAASPDRAEGAGLAKLTAMIRAERMRKLVALSPRTRFPLNRRR